MRAIFALLLVLSGCGDNTCTTNCAMDASVGDAPFLKRRVFVTAATFPGDLKTAGGGSGGLDGADKLCNMAAAGAQLTGTFTAWLATANLDATARITVDGQWALADGTIAFPNRAALATGPSTSLAFDEKGMPVVAITRVWTGTLASGAHGSLNCADWTNATSMNSGVAGDVSSKTSSWTSANAATCDQMSHLYCFEQ
jgi:hypothetical protein